MNKNLPGVYMIMNIETNGRYVGSTPRQLKSRWAEHRSTLRNNRNGNRNLQSSWNEYGEDAFVFIVLENTFENNIYEREQYWMDKFNNAGFELYNHCPNANSHLGLIMPKGFRKNRSDIQKKYWADMPSDKRKAYSEKMKELYSRPEMKAKISNAVRKGVYKRNQSREPIYLRSPEGEVIAIHQRHIFCLEHNLDPSAITKVLKSKRPSYKGWTLPDPIQKKKPKSHMKSFQLRNPDGEVMNIVGIRPFSKEYNLRRASITQLVMGKIKSYNGWTLP